MYPNSAQPCKPTRAPALRTSLTTRSIVPPARPTRFVPPRRVSVPPRRGLRSLPQMRQLNALANSTSLVAFWGGRVGVSLSNGNTYTYDALGSMTSQTDARNCTTNLTYDLLNRPTQKSYSNCPSTSTVTYGYDSGTNGIGRRTSMTDGSGSAAWLYDSRGRVWKETKVISGSSFVTEWTYNSADLPITMKYPGGEIVTTTYDNNMLLKTVIGTATYVSNTQYDSASRMTSRALGNGLTQNYAYYPWNQQGGRLQTLAIGSLQNLTYAYDSVGNINTITDSINSQTQSFGYDALDRLTSASASGESWQGAYSETYSYDPATGNLQTKGGVTLAYGDANHVHAVTGAGGNSYQYDSNGSQITRTIGSDIFNLYYDAENRLVEVKKNSVTIAQFTFDGDGKRAVRRFSLLAVTTRRRAVPSRNITSQARQELPCESIPFRKI
jgi:YD repeat-containing protein